MITFILWLIVGAVVGWLASLVMHTDSQQGTLTDIIVGALGALLAGLLFGASTINNGNFSLTSFLISLVGAIILLGVVNLFRRGTVR